MHQDFLDAHRAAGDPYGSLGYKGPLRVRGPGRRGLDQDGDIYGIICIFTLLPIFVGSKHFGPKRSIMHNELTHSNGVGDFATVISDPLQHSPSKKYGNFDSGFDLGFAVSLSDAHHGG